MSSESPRYGKRVSPLALAGLAAATASASHSLRLQREWDVWSFIDLTPLENFDSGFNVAPPSRIFLLSSCQQPDQCYSSFRQVNIGSEWSQIWNCSVEMERQQCFVHINCWFLNYLTSVMFFNPIFFSTFFNVSLRATFFLQNVFFFEFTAFATIGGGHSA